ncbi:hypothetical protein SAMN04487831_11510 [Pseudobutyrivibrio sp. UC1225]|uniref:O-antigen ligase family protein n=1 Tax=Pseudobutyrivibrio sp. UC1225 TaxID=1798185 RepID=UPI0008E03D4A|nr:hypothetical protein [Pseudobutyrivibrio sp. UC1225]SFO26644.1 hypothetical protein SAMN04487831_11510 [Pseudobutyrivibrio sp. UC1225]
MSKYIKIDMTYIMSILMIFATLISLSFVPKYSSIREMLIIIVGLYVLIMIPKLVKKTSYVMWILLSLFCAVTIGTSYVHRVEYQNQDIFMASLKYALSLVEIYAMLNLLVIEGKLQSFINVFYKLLFGILICNDIIAFISGYNHITFLLGTKFAVVYWHLFWIALYLYLHDTQNIKWGTIALFMSYMVVLCLWISCATGIVGTFIFVVMYMFFTNAYTILGNKWVYLLFLLICGSFAFTYTFVLNSALVQKVVTEYLGRSLTLTGRVNIYELLPLILLQRPWFGYGFGTTYTVYMFFTGYADSQNGIVEWMSQVGVIGTIFLIGFMTYMFAFANKYKSIRKVIYPFIILIYIFIFISTVEISYNRIFLSILGIIWAIALGNEGEINEEN